MWPPWKEGERDPMSPTPHGVHPQVLTWCLGLSGGPELYIVMESQLACPQHKRGSSFPWRWSGCC